MKTVVTADVKFKTKTEIKTETENKLKTVEWNALHVELIHIYLATLLTNNQCSVK